MAKKDEAPQVYIQDLRSEVVEVAIVGTSPLIVHRMAEKARQELLLPKGRKTSADKAQNLKHNPIEEFRASVYMDWGEDGETALVFPSSAVKSAMMTAALEMPGTKKAQIGRLVIVHGAYVPLWGVPKLFMAITRSSDMNKTPDVRTRAILPQWAMLLRIEYVIPALTGQGVINLLNAAGRVAGLGDWRPEKGKGAFGRFTVCSADDEMFREIAAVGGRMAQLSALKEPEPYDAETEELLEWFHDELTARGRK